MTKNKDLIRIMAKMEAIPRAIRKDINPEVQKGAEEIASLQRALAASSRDTGALMDSITVTDAGQTIPPYAHPSKLPPIPDGAAMITVGNSDVRYAHLVEYGTSKTDAQPFFWDGYRLGRQRAVNRINRVVRKKIREAWNKGAPQGNDNND